MLAFVFSKLCIYGLVRLKCIIFFEITSHLMTTRRVNNQLFYARTLESKTFSALAVCVRFSAPFCHVAFYLTLQNGL